MTVSIYAADLQELGMDLSHNNFHWLMTVLELPYTYENEAMHPADVMAAIANFRQAYCYRIDRRVTPGLMQEKFRHGSASYRLSAPRPHHRASF